MGVIFEESRHVQYHLQHNLDSLYPFCAFREFLTFLCEGFRHVATCGFSHFTQHYVKHPYFSYRHNASNRGTWAFKCLLCGDL